MTRQFCGRSVGNLYLRQSYKLNIIAIESVGKTTTEIDPDYVLREGDILVVIGKENRISELEGDISSGVYSPKKAARNM